MEDVKDTKQNAELTKENLTDEEQVLLLVDVVTDIEKSIDEDDTFNKLLLK